MKLPDHMFRPPQISNRFPSIIFVKRKVTSPDEELRTILRHPFVIHLTDEKFCLIPFWFLERFLQVRAVWDCSLTDFPPTSGVVLAPFPASTPPTIPFPLLLQTTPLEHCDSLDQIERKNKLTNIPPEKKNSLEGDPPAVWLMGFIRERSLTLSVWGAWSESNPYFFCIHLSSYNSYQLSIADTRLSTVGW